MNALLIYCKYIKHDVNFSIYKLSIRSYYVITLVKCCVFNIFIIISIAPAKVICAIFLSRIIFNTNTTAISWNSKFNHLHAVTLVNNITRKQVRWFCNKLLFNNE